MSDCKPCQKSRERREATAQAPQDADRRRADADSQRASIRNSGAPSRG